MRVRMKGRETLIASLKQQWDTLPVEEKRFAIGTLCFGKQTKIATIAAAIGRPVDEVRKVMR
jgi:hypothetical protein